MDNYSVLATDDSTRSVKEGSRGTTTASCRDSAKSLLRSGLYAFLCASFQLDLLEMQKMQSVTARETE